MKTEWPENIEAFTLADGTPVYGVGRSGQEVTLSTDSIHTGGKLKEIVARNRDGEWSDTIDPEDIAAIESYLERIGGVPAPNESEKMQSTFRSLIESTLQKPLEANEQLDGMLKMNLLPEASKIKKGIVGVLNDAKRMRDQGGTVTATILQEDLFTMLENNFGVESGNMNTIDDDVSHEARVLIEYLLENVKFSEDSQKERARIERTLGTVLRSAFGLIKQSPNPGDDFDAKTMNASSVIDTVRDDEDKTIDEVVTDGYGYNPSMSRVLEKFINQASGIQQKNELLALKSDAHVFKPRVRVFVKKQS